MTTRSQDLRPQHQDQRHQWDSVAEGWRKWWPTIEKSAQHVSMRMLDLAEVAAGQRVLDLGTGIGEPALRAATRVGASGQVVGTDLSSKMLAIARERAEALGLTNVAFVETDTTQLAFPDRSFEAILCRWGMVALSSPVLAQLRPLLAPNGKLVAAVWARGLRGRPLASLVASVAAEVFDVPPAPAETSGPEGSEMTAVVKEMARAGFLDVRVEEVTLTLEFPSSAECIQYLADVSPDFVTLLSNSRSDQQKRYRQRLTERLQEYAISGAVRLPNVTLCAVGRRG